VSEGDVPVVDAATVVVLRAGPEGAGIEVLMLHKHTGHAFGGMWVFPGGRVDPDDGAADSSGVERARHAAAREAAEEAGLVVSADDLVPFAHWTPPPEAPRRFATWFFVAEARDVREIVVDGGEIKDHAWVSPAEALERHSRREIDLAIPTWVTLHGLQEFESTVAVLDAARAGAVTYYATRIAHVDGDLVAMWEGDAGYETSDPALPGARHRLRMAADAPWDYELALRR
jgi:8-oxo-dGTP pyrophosphatase MutT (NUDIX family)